MVFYLSRKIGCLQPLSSVIDSFFQTRLSLCYRTFNFNISLKSVTLHQSYFFPSCPISVLLALKINGVWSCVCVFLYVCPCVCFFVCVTLRSCLCLWMCVCLFVYLGVCVWLFLSVCLFVCVFLCVSLCVCFGVSVFLWVCAFVCLSLCVFMCVCDRMSVQCFGKFLRLWMFKRKKITWAKYVNSMKLKQM